MKEFQELSAFLSSASNPDHLKLQKTKLWIDSCNLTPHELVSSMNNLLESWNVNEKNKSYIFLSMRYCIQNKEIDFDLFKQMFLPRIITDNTHLFSLTRDWLEKTSEISIPQLKELFLLNRESDDSHKMLLIRSYLKKETNQIGSIEEFASLLASFDDFNDIKYLLLLDFSRKKDDQIFGLEFLQEATFELPEDYQKLNIILNWSKTRNGGFDFNSEEGIEAFAKVLSSLKDESLKENLIAQILNLGEQDQEKRFENFAKIIAARIIADDDSVIENTLKKIGLNSQNITKFAIKVVQLREARKHSDEELELRQEILTPFRAASYSDKSKDSGSDNSLVSTTTFASDRKQPDSEIPTKSDNQKTKSTTIKNPVTGGLLCAGWQWPPKQSKSTDR
jgi:hypothetical protein